MEEPRGIIPYAPQKEISPTKEHTKKCIENTKALMKNTVKKIISDLSIHSRKLTTLVKHGPPPPLQFRHCILNKTLHLDDELQQILKVR